MRLPCCTDGGRRMVDPLETCRAIGYFARTIFGLLIAIFAEQNEGNGASDRGAVASGPNI